ncbi:MAG: hypothetical protein SNF93_05570 [Rikenellaceae bacterium]
MRKVTKILLMLLSTTILLLIILPLLLSLLLSLGSVQNFAIERFAQIASRKIEAKVEVGGVYYTLPNSIVLYDLLIEDVKGDTMIFSKVASARISRLSPMKKELTVGLATLKDSKVHLREVDGNILNIKDIVTKISNPNGDASFKTTFTKIDVDNLEFSLERLPRQSGDSLVIAKKKSLAITKENQGVDLNNIRIDSISGQISNLVSHQRITQFTIDKFEGRERSGFTIESLKTDFVTYEGVVDFVNFYASTPSSRIYLPKLRLEGYSWEDYQDFNANVSIDLQSQYSKLSATDVGYFAPALYGKTFEANALRMSLNGTVNNLEVSIDNLSFGSLSSLKGTLAVRDVTQIESAEFEVDIDKLTTSRSDINTTLEGFGGSALKAGASKIVGNLGAIALEATATGSLASMNLNAKLTSSQGSARYIGRLRDLTSSPKISGKVATTSLNLGGVLANKSLGAITLDASVEYAQMGKSFSSKVDGSVSSLGYNSYTYSGVDFKATCDDSKLDGAITSHDPAFDFNLVGVANLGQDPHYDITMRVNSVDLNALEINHRDSISRVSGSLRVNMGGTELDDLNGSIVLRNISYKYNDESLYIPMIDITARNNSQSKYLALKSDYVDLNFNSKSSYNALYDYLQNGLREYIPLLYTDHTERKDQKRVTLANNYSTLSINFKEFSVITNAMFSGFAIADDSSFSMMINPVSERFSLRLRSDYVEHKTLSAIDLNINASNDKDSLSMYATASDFLVGSHSFSSASLMAGARNNVVELSSGFRDTLSSVSATLGMRVLFDSVQRARIQLLPSQISMNDDMWMISAKEIEGEGARLTIDDFAMVNGSQRLNLNGAISKDTTDSLMLTLNNYDIAMLTSVVNNMGYTVDGLSNGYVNIHELLGSPRIVADVQLDSVSVNTIPSPPLRLLAGWETQQNRARVLVSNRNNRDTLITGYYAPSDTRYYAHMRTDSVSMSLIDPLLKTTISGTKGYANVDLTLQGQHKTASLNGVIDVYDLSTKIHYTQVDYFVPQARIDVQDNKLSTFARTMYDVDGNHGLVTMNLSLDHLSNVSYNMRIVPENMLVLNTTEQDNELFYGKLYASGVATISGDKRGVTMDITATSKPNSSFFMPLSTQSSVAKTDFITFVQREKKVDDQSTVVNYRRAYIDERNQRMGNQTTAQLNINMALQATPDLDFQLVIDPVVGDIIKAKGEGRLNLNIAPQQNIFEMYGDYSITEGNYLFTLLNPISKRFVIENGSSIQWTGDPLDPLLNIDAVYKVKTSLDPLTGSTSSDDSSSSRAVPVDCIIKLGDRLTQPSVNFGIEVPTADTEQQAVIANTLIDQETISQQFFYLMFANSFIPVTTSYGSGLSSTTTATTGFELLTNQLSNWLSSSNYNVVIRYRPESDLTSDEVDVGFSRGLIDNRLLIEVEGNYLADNKTSVSDSDFSNFMGEAYVTWLIDRAGSLRLKGFTQTIDRYDENQGLQETGVGVYYSESFNEFKDLKQKIKDRFKRKK